MSDEAIYHLGICIWLVAILILSALGKSGSWQFLMCGLGFFIELLLFFLTRGEER